MSSLPYTRHAPLLVVHTALAVFGVPCDASTGRWRQRRLVPITLAVLAGYALLARRLGWGELLVVAVLVVPVMFLPARLVGGGSR